MNQQGGTPAGQEDDWWGQLYGGATGDTGPTAAPDSLDDRFASASGTVNDATAPATAEPAPAVPPQRTDADDPPRPPGFPAGLPKPPGFTVESAPPADRPPPPRAAPPPPPARGSTTSAAARPPTTASPPPCRPPTLTH
ncbi:hypothetical protein SZN_35552 [Streptomyces zinciresistens K42]|uniref:Uncharacterized protein n=1 Tax=Streptomyces zinciresistens K42 TaxID=700597 RepID=G2GNK5_9ACTN|nr:hypothetical protein [Streptomyces zinciresistens]EGX54905.1 hypothetical protein SZN_35552 [Streptomyces zinciresistens K42]